MVKGNKIKELNAKTILSLVDSYSIYRYYLGRDFMSGKAIFSPFRKEDHESFCVTFSREGEWLHTDYANTQYRGNCFQFVCQLFNISYNQALEKIDSDFQLGIKGKKGNYEKIIAVYKPPKVDVKRETTIQVKVRKWNTEELEYWKQYGLNREDLKGDNFKIYVPEEIWLNRKRFPCKGKLMFCYLFENKYWKIYTPYASREDKWISNTPVSLMYGLSNISNCGKAIITKSVKDMLSLQKLYPCVAGCQNESTIAINEENIQYLRKNSKEIYIAFDSDAPGKQNSWFYTKNYGMKHLNTPDSLLSEGVKDWSGWIALEGIDVVREFLKNKGVL